MYISIVRFYRLKNILTIIFEKAYTEETNNLGTTFTSNSTFISGYQKLIPKKQNDFIHRMNSSALFLQPPLPHLTHPQPPPTLL